MLGSTRAVLFNGFQPGVEHEDLWSPTLVDVEAAAQEAGLLRRFGSGQHHLALDALVVLLGLDDVAKERHLAGPSCRCAQRVADDRLSAEEHVVQLGDNRRVEGGELARSPAGPSTGSSDPRR